MRRLVLILLLSVWVAPADAHKSSDSYLTLSLQAGHLTGQWDIALRDLDFAIGLDADGNGEITWGEVKAKHKEIAAYALARLVIAADGAGCPITVIQHLIDNHSDGAYEVMRFTAICPEASRFLSIEYNASARCRSAAQGIASAGGPGRHSFCGFQPGPRNLAARRSFGGARAPISRFLSNRCLAHLDRL